MIGFSISDYRVDKVVFDEYAELNEEQIFTKIQDLISPLDDGITSEESIGELF